MNNSWFAHCSESREVGTSGYKWFYVVKSGLMWFYVVKLCYVVKWFYVAKWLYVAKWFYVVMWLSGFMWLKVTKIVERICNIFSLTCALPERSVKSWPKGFLSMLNSKIAGTTTSFQRFPLKN